MKSSHLSKKALSRSRILTAAAAQVREAGFAGVAVAEVMKEAGLTHGGFYAHFTSRDALLAEAVVHASEQTGALVGTHLEHLVRSGESAFRGLVEAYLADGQIGNCAGGCPVAALCSQMPIQSPSVQDASRQIIANLHRLVQAALPQGAPEAHGWAVTSALVGALQLARALGDNLQGRAVLAAARTQLIAQYDNPRR